MKKIALLTSSRADYGIYVPLITLLDRDADIDLDIIAFGTHNMAAYGNTVSKIESDGFHVAHKVVTKIAGDDAHAVSVCMAETSMDFAKIWSETAYDFIICLGDRYEMFAAVSASVPFNIPVAHIAGGETTLGAIDNKFRHCLSLFSSLHFASTEFYRQRIVEIMGEDENIFDTGSLSFDNLKHQELLSLDEFQTQFNIDLSIPSILITFHPETVEPENNAGYADELIAALECVSGLQYIITMPNADTYGNVIREKLNAFIDRNENAVGVESFGMVGYLTCMKHCTMMLGNTSSGFVEASYFPKYVINLGRRQEGRFVTQNILNTPIRKDDIVKQIHHVLDAPALKPDHIYGDGNSAQKIMTHIKKFINCEA